MKFFDNVSPEEVAAFLALKIPGSGQTTLRVLSRLREGPALNIELSQISPTIHDHIFFLRKAKYPIECQGVKGHSSAKGGIYEYRLLEGVQIPVWSIGVQTTLHNGEVINQTVQVEAFTERQAKSSARNKAAKTITTSCSLLESVTKREHDTHLEGH